MLTTSRDEIRKNKNVPVFAGYRGKRCLDIVRAGIAGTSVVDCHDKRVWILDHVALNPIGYPAQSGLSQRLFPAKDARAWNRPINDISGRPVRNSSRAVSGFRPDDWMAIVTCDKEEPLPDRRGTKIAGSKLLPLDHITQFPQATHKGHERCALLGLYDLPVLYRPPVGEFLHVLKEYLPRLYLFSPTHHYPSQLTALNVPNRSAALGLQEKSAIRGCPQ